MTESTARYISTRDLAVHFIRLAAGVIVVALPIFGGAGTIQYWNGWLFMAALFVPMTVALVYLYKNHRALLEKRLKVREKEREQKTYVKLSLLWFFISFAVPGLDYRFGWSSVPVWLVVTSVFVMIGGYVLFMVAMVQNSFASRVIELQSNQRVIDTGLYSIVRHPMYMAASIMFTACPLVLGSFCALIPSALLPVLLAYRIRNEERILLTGLAGYGEYTQRVKYRMIPYVW
ncbi:MAG TPA: isoprenylcysteine carboxylmethyltransferase family protein [Bacteroidota bacterium]